MDSVNSGLRKMANFFEDISKNTSSSRFYVSEELTLYELLPSKFGQFKYTYIGTMIYGACERDVIWMEFEEKLPISAEEVSLIEMNFNENILNSNNFSFEDSQVL